jgi:magnesium-transporting ATPase (P-type)
MSSDKKNSTYTQALDSAEGITPYGQFKTQLLESLGHDDFWKKFIEILGNRKDADKLFWGSIFRNKYFWLTIISCSFVLSCLVILFFPKQSYHIFESYINSKVPGVIPPFNAL